MPVLDYFVPNKKISANSKRLLIVVQIAVAILIWLNSPFKILPKPQEVAAAFGQLWMSEGLGPELVRSFELNLMALLYSTIISIGLAYLTVMPFFRPIAAAISKGRFLSLAGFSIIFTFAFGGGRPLQTSMLVFGITVFYLTSMSSVVSSIPKADLDHARTLRMSEWRVVWEVVVLGTVDKAFEVLRQNAAIGWMMLTMVEGIVRSGGGVGVMLLNEMKHFKLAEVYAIQLAILLVGLFQDGIIVGIRKLVCPYADLTVEKK